MANDRTDSLTSTGVGGFATILTRDTFRLHVFKWLSVRPKGIHGLLSSSAFSAINICYASIPAWVTNRTCFHWFPHSLPLSVAPLGQTSFWWHVSAVLQNVFWSLFSRSTSVRGSWWDPLHLFLFLLTPAIPVHYLACVLYYITISWWIASHSDIPGHSDILGNDMANGLAK